MRTWRGGSTESQICPQQHRYGFCALVSDGSSSNPGFQNGTRGCKMAPPSLLMLLAPRNAMKPAAEDL